MRRRLPHILVAIVAIAAALSVGARPPGSVGGSYNVIVAGDFTGGGKVTVGGGGNLNINLKVKDLAGNEGRLKARVDVVNNRFHGTGEVMGRPIEIQGRLDPADQSGEQLRGARLVATFGDNAGNTGRLAGSPNLDGRGGGGGGGGGDDADDDDGGD